jgi:hypothetical protein
MIALASRRWFRIYWDNDWLLERIPDRPEDNLIAFITI